MKFNLVDAIIALMIAVGALCFVGLVIGICWSDWVCVLLCGFGISSAAFVGAGIAGRKDNG